MYSCSKCPAEVQHAYKVLQRTVRAVVPKELGGTGRHDAVSPWHDGIIVGPGFDILCKACYDKIPSIKEILNAYKRSLN